MAQAITIQIKTNLRTKPGGGKGKEALDWGGSEAVPAALIALVDLSSEKVWLFKLEEFFEFARQRSSGHVHLYMYTDPSAKPTKEWLAHAHVFERIIISNRISELLAFHYRFQRKRNSQPSATACKPLCFQPLAYELEVEGHFK
jgi:hypothetical protein